MCLWSASRVAVRVDEVQGYMPAAPYRAVCSFRTATWMAPCFCLFALGLPQACNTCRHLAVRTRGKIRGGCWDFMTPGTCGNPPQSVQGSGLALWYFTMWYLMMLWPNNSRLEASLFTSAAGLGWGDRPQSGSPDRLCPKMQSGPCLSGET